MMISGNWDGSRDVQLPADEDTVEVVMCKANGIVIVNKKSYYSNKLHHCNSTDELTRALAKSKSKCCALQRSTSSVAVQSCIETDMKNMTSDEFQKYNIKAKNGAAFDEKTGEVQWEYRQIKSLRLSWRNQSYCIYNSAYYETSVGVTIHLDTQPTFAEMSKLATDFSRHIKRKYKDNFKCGFIFLEPCYNGSWHVHFILNFYNAFPKKFEIDITKWWCKFNKIENSNQVAFSYFKSINDFVNYVGYLNPADLPKKRNRVRFYPKSSQPIRHFGDVEAPNAALVTYDIAKKIVGSDEPTKRTKTEIIDVETNEMLYSRTTYYHYNISNKLKNVCCLDNTRVKEKNNYLKQHEEQNLNAVPVGLENFNLDDFEIVYDSFTSINEETETEFNRCNY